MFCLPLPNVRFPLSSDRQFVTTMKLFYNFRVMYEIIQIDTSLRDLVSFDTVRSQKTYFRLRSRSYRPYWNDKIRSDKIIQIEFQIESRSDPNITTHVLDLRRLFTMYLQIRSYTIRCVHYDAMCSVAIGHDNDDFLFTIMIKDDYELSYMYEFIPMM